MTTLHALPAPNFVILYVASPTDSARFYTSLLGQPPLEASPGFAMFALNPGTMLGLWAAAHVEPTATAPGGSEIAFSLDSRAAVDAAHAAWKAHGLPIAQPPTAMDFGYTFVALDPDGHRLRVMVPTEG